MTGLTPKQSAALDFIVAYVDERGFSPSYREIADAVGLSKGAAAMRLVNCLIERGYLARLAHKARSLEVLRRDPGNPSPYSVEAVSQLPQVSLEGLEAVVRTVLSTRLRDRVLASPDGSCPALERHA